jgi:hypothetical protein
MMFLSSILKRNIQLTIGLLFRCGEVLQLEIIQKIEGGVISSQAQGRVVLAVACLIPFLEGTYPTAQISFTYVLFCDHNSQKRNSFVVVDLCG